MTFNGSNSKNKINKNCDHLVLNYFLKHRRRQTEKERGSEGDRQKRVWLDPRERETKREIPLASFAGLKSVIKRDAEKERGRGERRSASERAKHASLTNAFQLSSSSSSSSREAAAAAPMRHKPSIEGKHEPQQQQQQCSTSNGDLASDVNTYCQ